METKKPIERTKSGKGKLKVKSTKQISNGKVKLSKKALAALAMIDRWRKEGPSDEDGSLEDFMKALERNRMGERKLFRD